MIEQLYVNDEEVTYVHTQDSIFPGCRSV